MNDAFGSVRSNGSSLSDLVHTVTRFGSVVPSRYGDTLEVLGGRLVIESRRLVYRPGINYSVGWMEAFQLIAGVYDPDQIQRVAPNADMSLFTFPMSYGPRVFDQIPAILQVLRQNPGTRQAVVFVGKPEDRPTADLPCTLTIQFLIRDDLLHAIVSMRSWDLCRGLPYDLMMFGMLLEVVGRCIQRETGKIIVQAGSTHIYLDYIDRIPKITDRWWEFADVVPDDWNSCREWFREATRRIEQGKVPPGICMVGEG